jgi:hypothetical protein
MTERSHNRPAAASSELILSFVIVWLTSAAQVERQPIIPIIFVPRDFDSSATVFIRKRRWVQVIRVPDVISNSPTDLLGGNSEDLIEPLAGANVPDVGNSVPIGREDARFGARSGRIIIATFR